MPLFVSKLLLNTNRPNNNNCLGEIDIPTYNDSILEENVHLDRGSTHQRNEC